MAKDSASVSQKQVPEGPLVRIEYTPETFLATLSSGASLALKKLRTAKITNVKELQSSSEILEDAEFRAEQIEDFKSLLREKVQQAIERFRSIEGFDDLGVTLTFRTWKLNQALIDGIRALKNSRAVFLANEEEKRRRAQLDAQAKQDAINKKAADDAAAAAQKAGADAATVKEIKREVLATPAPVVQSKAEAVAEEVGASVRYGYAAQITSLEKFLLFALNNPVMLATLAQAKPDIEKAFRKMAGDQKEAFNYPGITFIKTPIDVSRRP